MNKQSKGTAVITGASAGIGAIYADRLARRGYDLLMIARDRLRLAKIQSCIEHELQVNVQILSADLNVDSDLARVEEIFRNDRRITLLVNNAGMGVSSPILESNIERMQAMIFLNVVALARLTYAAAQSFSARRQGAIINIASAVAIAPEVMNGVYGGTKAFVLALSQSLKHELADKGVRIQVVLPGAIRTDFWALSGIPVESLPREVVMSGEDVVDAALAGFDLGEFATIPSLPDANDWGRFEEARLALRPNLSRDRPADRYRARTEVL